MAAVVLSLVGVGFESRARADRSDAPWLRPHGVRGVVGFSGFGTIGFETLYRGLRMSDYATYTGTDTFLSLFQIGGTIAAHF